MTIKVTFAPNEEEAEKAVKKQYQGFDLVFLKKVKKDQSEDYIYYFDLADTTVIYQEEKKDNDK
jgi:ribosomal 30S subunit maturation factor RimM